MYVCLLWLRVCNVITGCRIASCNLALLLYPQTVSNHDYWVSHCIMQPSTVVVSTDWSGGQWLHGHCPAAADASGPWGKHHSDCAPYSKARVEWAACIGMTSVCGSVCSTRGFVQSETLGILQSDFFYSWGGGGGWRGDILSLDFFRGCLPRHRPPNCNSAVSQAIPVLLSIVILCVVRIMAECG